MKYPSKKVRQLVLVWNDLGHVCGDIPLHRIADVRSSDLQPHTNITCIISTLLQTSTIHCSSQPRLLVSHHLCFLLLNPETISCCHVVYHAMFSSFSSFTLPFALPRLLGGDPGSAIDIHPVDVRDIETKHERPARTLKHLLKLNHVTHSIVYHNLEFHNHMPHVCASAVNTFRICSFSATDPRISLPSGS